MRAALLGMLLGCGGTVPLPPDASVASDGEPEREDGGGALMRGDATTPPPRDAAACLGLPLAKCMCTPGPCDGFWSTVLRDTIDGCKSAQFVCGNIYVTFDEAGCAESFSFVVTGPAAFRACVEQKVSALRWPCVANQKVRTFVESCTVN